MVARLERLVSDIADDDFVIDPDTKLAAARRIMGLYPRPGNLSIENTFCVHDIKEITQFFKQMLTCPENTDSPDVKVTDLDWLLALNGLAIKKTVAYNGKNDRFLSQLYVDQAFLLHELGMRELNDKRYQKAIESLDNAAKTYNLFEFGKNVHQKVEKYSAELCRLYMSDNNYAKARDVMEDMYSKHMEKLIFYRKIKSHSNMTSELVKAAKLADDISMMSDEYEEWKLKSISHEIELAQEVCETNPGYSLECTAHAARKSMQLYLINGCARDRKNAMAYFKSVINSLRESWQEKSYAALKYCKMFKRLNEDYHMLLENRVPI